MTKLLWKSLLVSPVVLAATLLAMPKAMSADFGQQNAASPSPEATTLAQATDVNVLDQVNRYSKEGAGASTSVQDQVTNVSQFSDVRPGDWAYESLRQLVERYGCIAGYPDSTYRGNRAMTRYEFAAGLNACLRQIEKLIAASTADFATKEDLETLRRLTQEFQAELATLGTRVDKLEGRVGFLENHQFSTTTKLVGEAIFALTDDFGDRRNTNTVFGDRVRLDLQTSFTGRDKLHTRLAAGNLTPFLNGATFKDPITGLETRNFGSAEGTQTFDVYQEGGNRINLDWLAYEFPFGSSQVYLSATGGRHSDYAPTNSPYFHDRSLGADSGNGSLSTFAQYSPIYRIGGGAGAGIRFGVGRAPILGPTSITLGYLGDNRSANNPNEDFGIFNGDYSALGQLNFNVGDRFSLAATYVHGYHNSGSTIFDNGTERSLVGTAAANRLGTAPVRSINNLGVVPTGPSITNSYGVQAAFRLSNAISLSGFIGKTEHRVLRSSAEGDIWFYGGGLALPDLGKKGNLAGIFVGVEPYLAGLERTDRQIGIIRDRSLHIEGFYKYQLTDNISITPGVVWITAPDQNDDNKDAVIGTLRTTFTF